MGEAMAKKLTSKLDPAIAREKYGPWAVIAGGSNGTGEAFARELASMGINVLLVARRKETLEPLAADIREKYGVETRYLVQDLMAPDAAQNMLDASADLDVGIYISNAGADDLAAPFFTESLERWKRLVQMNVLTLTEAVHGFGNRLLKRGRGGILIMSSGAALAGTPNLQMYSATKSFEMTLTEGLWCELQDTDVDVSCLLAPAMDTPFFRKSITGELLKQMLAADLVFDPADIARETLAQLAHQPIQYFTDRDGKTAEEVLAARMAPLKGAIERGKAYGKSGDRK